jgi:hypothetical protein
VEPGEFVVGIGASSADIRQSVRVLVRSDNEIRTPAVSGPVVQGDGLCIDDDAFAAMLGRPVPAIESSRPFHINSSVNEIGQTWIGAKFRERVVANFREQMGGQSNDEVLNKMFETMADQMPLRGLEMFSGGKLKRDQLELLVAVLNNRYLQALRLWLQVRAGSSDS